MNKLSKKLGLCSEVELAQSLNIKGNYGLSATESTNLEMSITLGHAP